MSRGSPIRYASRRSRLSKPKVAVVGASGLVGAALCERLFFDGEFEPVALLHNVGRGARVARLGIHLRVVDLLDQKQVLDGIAGCDYVVNCSRDGAAVMVNGLKNLLDAANKSNAKGLIHISSAAIYGNPASDCVVTESTPPDPGDEYATLKLRQDEVVLSGNSAGLRCVVLCPPTILGPYSDFTLSVAKNSRQGRVPLVDGGRNYANFVHVDNLVQAIVAAMHSEVGWGERYLVNETEKMTWAQFFSDFHSILGSEPAFVPVSSAEVVPARVATSKRAFTDNFKILASGEFRSALSLFPAFRALNERAYSWFNSANPAFQRWVRRHLQRPTTVAKQSAQRPLDDYLVRIQTRKVYYSPEKVMNKLGYRPVLSYQQQMQTMQAWLKFALVA